MNTLGSWKQITGLLCTCLHTDVSRQKTNKQSEMVQMGSVISHVEQRCGPYGTCRSTPSDNSGTENSFTQTFSSNTDLFLRGETTFYDHLIIFELVVN